MHPSLFCAMRTMLTQGIVRPLLACRETKQLRKAVLVLQEAEGRAESRCRQAQVCRVGLERAD